MGGGGEDCQGIDAEEFADVALFVVVMFGCGSAGDVVLAAHGAFVCVRRGFCGDLRLVVYADRAL